MGRIRIIYAEQNLSYEGELYSIYIVLRLIFEMQDGSNNQKGKIQIRCNNLAGVLDSSQTALKTKWSKTFKAILRAKK